MSGDCEYQISVRCESSAPDGNPHCRAIPNTSDFAVKKVSEGGAPVHLAMGFPESVAQPDPAPVSAEEKRQASEP